MKNIPLKSVLYLLAPCIGLGGFAFYQMRQAEKVATAKAAAQAKAKAALLASKIPVKFALAGVEEQPLAFDNRYQGYDRHFAVVFTKKSGKPTWWGQPVNNAQATSMRNWEFWLEHKGKRSDFKPQRSLITTTEWDMNKKRYINDVFLNVGDVPTEASLKMKGVTKMVLANGNFTSGAFPVEVTLKKAGEKWSRTADVTNPNVAVEKVEITPSHKGQTLGIITYSRSPIFDKGIVLSEFEVLDEKLRPLKKGLLPANSVSRTPTGEVAVKMAPNTLQMWWSSEALAKSAAKSILLRCQLEQMSEFPLEIVFAIKKDGQLVSGTVPFDSLIPKMFKHPRTKSSVIQIG